jgi:serine/threonine-protein kinase
MIGRTVSHYRIVDQLGAGGMGVVYLAEDTRLGRKVAIKFLLSGPEITDEIRERFVTEAKAAAALNHPNIATVHGIGEDGDNTFIIMEFVQGEELKDWIQDGRVDVDTAYDLALQIAEGLRAAHDEGIVHRDIKSANIMVLPDGRAKILDFGLARMDGGTMVTTMGMSMGTVAYMSPEQARGEPVDQRTDIWAFGVVVYEMLTGRMPFPGAYEQSVMYAIFNEEPPPLTELEQAVGEAFAPILRKLLSKDVNLRYGSMQEVINDLKALHGGEPTSVTKSVIAPAPVETSAQPSIAVMPFSDMSREKDQEYFCDGITEELIDVLSHVETWRVVARTSTFSFKGQDVDVRDVGQRLSASHVLEGSLRKSGPRVRITTRLTGVSDGYQLWSDKYDGQLDDIFDIQDRIAGAVLKKLKGSLDDAEGGVDGTPLVKRSTDDMEAYNLYLQARFHMNKRSEGDLKAAVGLCEQAIRMDAGFAPPYAGMADALVLLAVQGGMKPSEAIPKAKAAAQKAISLDESLAEAHTSLGTILAAFEWNQEAAERSFKRAIELNPSYATGHQWYGLWCLMPQQRFEECLAQYRLAIELDPLSQVLGAGLGWMLYLARSYDEAETQLRRTLEVNSDFVMAHDLLGQTLAQQDRLDDAIAELEMSVLLSGRRSLSVSMLAYLYGLAERNAESFVLGKELELAMSLGYVSPYDMALVHCGLGNDEEAIYYLEQALDQRNPWLLLIGVEPMWDRMRGTPGFDDVVRAVGLERS